MKAKEDMIESPLISVIIPVYNGERYIVEAIESVITQKYKNIEIIVINDGSTDRTEEILNSYKNVKHLYQSKQGAPSARNTGIKFSTGELIAFLDADDLWTKDKLEIQTSIFKTLPDLDMVFGHVKQFYSPELKASQRERIYMIADSMPGYLPGTMLVKKRSFFRVGLFNSKFKIGEFIDWYSRAVDYGLKSCLASEVLLKRRIHDSNTGITERDSRKDYLRILKTSLDRRRSAEIKERN
ncbi:MAG: glycosyltransferase family 2 protein [Nitrospiraceae bacterium]|nr:glycosyltransferase family 2 protein [Nitrospiraceae bacterium]